MKKKQPFQTQVSDASRHDLSVETKHLFLKDVKVGLVGGGGIAAIELPKIARELRRYGALVRFYVTENCLRFIGREALEWASGELVTVTPTGFADHICQDDMVLVLPGTADLVAKLAHGICSDGASTYLQSAIGQKKLVLICPTMHKSLSESEFVKENFARVKKQDNVIILPPREEEGKLKAPDPQLLAKLSSHFFNRVGLQKNKKPTRVLVTLGGSRVLIDAVRCLTNISTGRLGALLVDELYCHGFEVDALVGQSEVAIQNRPGLSVTVEPNFEGMYAFLKNIKPTNYSGFFHVAALSDYLFKGDETKKMSSKQSTLELKLTAAPKMIELANLKKIAYRFACKLTETNEDAGLKIATEFMNKHSLNGILWNNASSAFKKATHEGIVIVKAKNAPQHVRVAGKQQLATVMVEHFENWFLG